MRPLQKTTIVIWTDPEEVAPDALELSDLAREADVGAAYCSQSETVTVAHPENDPDWDGTEFFDPLTD